MGEFIGMLFIVAGLVFLGVCAIGTIGVILVNAVSPAIIWLGEWLKRHNKPSRPDTSSRPGHHSVGGEFVPDSSSTPHWKR